MSKPLTFQPPFKGSWFVYWGGDNKILNYHHDDPAEKYALDMIIIDKNGFSHPSSGSKNEDYYAFGQDILAAAAGEVVEAVDGLRDNRPRKSTNNYAFSGNFVMIKHSGGIYSVLAHLQQHSIVVKAGQKVTAGQKIGKCGNSGNSTEPHLHFHVQDNSVLTKISSDYKRVPLAKGVKAYFETTVWRNNKKSRKSRHAPVRGDILSPVLK